MAICAVVLVIVAYPLYYVLVASSFSAPCEVYAGKTFLLPSGFTIDGCKAVFVEKGIVTGFLNSVKCTVTGTIFSVVITQFLDRKPKAMSGGGCKVELSPENTLFATVEVSELMGSEVRFHANILGRDVVVIVPTMDVNGTHIKSFSTGDTLNLTFNGSVCHVFDRDGRNLEL